MNASAAVGAVGTAAALPKSGNDRAVALHPCCVSITSETFRQEKTFTYSCSILRLRLFGFPGATDYF